MRALHERGEANRPWEALPSAPPARPCFLRFASLEVHEDSRRRSGIFQTAFRVLDDADIDPHLERMLPEELHWFDANLHAPYVLEERAVFLFKASAKECMRHAWRLLDGLRRAGAIVEMQTVVNPGRVVFEDDLQVAVVPWSDAEFE